MIVLHLWAICVVNWWKRNGQKLRRIILLHFGLVTSRFGYGRTLILMIWGFSDVPLSPKTNIIYLGNATMPKKIQEKCQIIIKNIMLENLDISKIEHLEDFGKNGHRRTMKIRIKISWTSCRDQCPQQNWNDFLKILHRGSISINKHEIEFVNLWNFETKKLWNQ